jgi:hypothetical protein
MWLMRQRTEPETQARQSSRVASSTHWAKRPPRDRQAEVVGLQTAVRRDHAVKVVHGALFLVICSPTHGAALADSQYRADVGQR